MLVLAQTASSFLCQCPNGYFWILKKLHRVPKRQLVHRVPKWVVTIDKHRTLLFGQDKWKIRFCEMTTISLTTSKFVNIVRRIICGICAINDFKQNFPKGFYAPF